MAVLTAQQITHTGTTVTTTAAAAAGDQCPPGDNVWLEVTNGSGAQIIVIVNSVTPSNYGTDEDLGVAVPAGATRRIGPLPAARFAAADGLVGFGYSAHASVTVACIRI